MNDSTGCLCLGYTPIDGVPDAKIKTIVLPVTVVLAMLNACGIVFGIICLVFITYKQKVSEQEIKFGQRW